MFAHGIDTVRVGCRRYRWICVGSGNKVLRTCGQLVSVDATRQVLHERLAFAFCIGGVGVTHTEALATVDHDADAGTPAIPTPVFQLFDTTRQVAASIDKTRGVAFHCPSLASGTYSTKGTHGDSQLALVPITVPVGAVQAWESAEPIRVASSVAGTTVNQLTFYLTNEEGEVVNTLGERFEAVLVLEYDVPLK
jgi:hypothetical protein